ncbi:MAG: glycosyltransferase family 2 protein [Gammaproteobacteria bacterium]|nr:glycosyltransferase family 2 protein [Gammaproteobacteria bacterium]
MTLFLISLAFIAYTYFGYPALLVLLSRGKPKAADDPHVAKPVCVVIPAYNEGTVVAAKIRQVLQSSYPRELLRVLVVSDGSTDDTLREARSIADSRVEVLDGGVRRGKMATLNFAMSLVREPIVILTDAGEMLEEHTIARLVARLADPRMGAVSGELTLVSMENAFSRTLGGYWRYERWIRALEGDFRSVVGATGPIYALRRALYRPLPADTILDDLAIPLEVVAQGYRVGYERRALAFERATLRSDHEFARKRRTLAGNFQTLIRYRRLLLPGSSIAWELWSHKVFRLIVPYALVGVLVGGLMLPAPWAVWVTGVQVAFYGTAAAGAWRRLPLAWLSIPYTFCVLNWAAVAGAYLYMTGQMSARWEKVK